MGKCQLHMALICCAKRVLGLGAKFVLDKKQRREAQTSGRRLRPRFRSSHLANLQAQSVFTASKPPSLPPHRSPSLPFPCLSSSCLHTHLSPFPPSSRHTSFVHTSGPTALFFLFGQRETKWFLTWRRSREPPNSCRPEKTRVWNCTQHIVDS